MPNSPADNRYYTPADYNFVETTNNINSSDWDSVWLELFLNLEKFPETLAVIRYNHLTIGTLFAPSIIDLLTKNICSNADLKKELVKAIDYINILSYTKLLDINAVERMVIDVAVSSRISQHPPEVTILDEEFNEFMFNNPQDLASMIQANKWLIAFYVIAYTENFISDNPSVD